MSIIPYKGLSVTQRELLEAMDRRRRKAISDELKNWGLRNTVKYHRKGSFDMMDIGAYSLGLKKFNRRSIRALERAGFVEVEYKFLHTVNRWEDPFTRTVKFKDHYENQYRAKITPAGYAYLARH